MPPCRSFTRVGTRTRLDRERTVVSWAYERDKSRSSSGKRREEAGPLTGPAIILQDFIERIYELMRALAVIGCPGALVFLDKVVFVGDVEGGQHRKADGVDGVGGGGHGSHFGVDIIRKLQNVFRIGAAQIVCLIEYLHSHAGVLRIFYDRVLRRCGHSMFSVEKFFACA